MNNSQHYDSITDAWQYMLGDHFHWGIFNETTNNLHDATVNLIDIMLNMITVSKDSKILDVGCGIGNPAVYINEKYRCPITGITNSAKGVEESKSNINSRGLSNSINFYERDALNNQFKENTFDIAWLLEMSHLIQNKYRLIKETIRTLKPGGEIVLCDLMFKRPLSAKEITDNKNDLITLDAAFGLAKIETFDNYVNYFELNKLKDIEILDVSEQVKQTPISWKENVVKNKDRISQHISGQAIEDFINSCDILAKYYNEDVWGYGVIKGRK